MDDYETLTTKLDTILKEFPSKLDDFMHEYDTPEHINGIIILPEQLWEIRDYVQKTMREIGQIKTNLMIQECELRDQLKLGLILGLGKMKAESATSQ